MSFWNDPECTITDNGGLRVTLDSEGRKELSDRLERGESYWSILCDMFEPYSCNGSYTPFDASNGNPFVGLTSAPCIAESMDYPDNGENEIVGRLWTSPDYMVTNELEALRDNGEFTWTLVPESAEA